MSLLPLRFILAFVVAVAVALTGPVATSQTVASNVVVITLDGYRWQEMFTGVASEYFTKDSKGQPGAMEQRFWRTTPDARRRALTPFLWGDVAEPLGRR